MVEQGDPKISIHFDGAYANRLAWNTNSLAGFANQADLRTFVTIVTGSRMEQPQATGVGEILAWKQILSLNNLLSSPSSNSGELSEVFLGKGRDERTEGFISIDHQVLLKRVMDQNGGLLNPEGYAEMLNNEVRRGLLIILGTEKLHMLMYTGAIMGRSVGAILLPSVLAHWQAVYLEGITAMIPNNDPIENIAMVIARGLDWMTRISGIGLPFVGSWLAVYRYRQISRQIQENPSQYTTSLNDMNPAKYLADIVSGFRYLRGEDNSLVKLES